MTHTRTAGGIVIGPSGTIAMIQVHNGNGAWLFPKGHIEEGEAEEETARREIAEETGLTDLEYIDDLGTYERYRITQDGSEDRSELKQIHMYLFAALPDAKLEPSLEVGKVRWVPLQNVVAECGYAKDSAWFTTVFERVRQAIQRD